jgi:pyrimidine-nucleoside phosphorylase
MADPVNAKELIRKKRDGLSLTRDELGGLVRGYLGGEVPEYQMAAFLMAVYFAGMTPEETSAFTDLMLRSGEIIDLSDIPGRKVDKHSTGGVGDKVSLILAPMVAACGVPVPMISGRGLGHTGGTLDKLESIPGFRVNLPVEEYRRIIAETGLVFAGQTEKIVPADRRLYALRDVTATIESFPLIAGSIMSKKLAEGIDALVLDVKCGNGAFMREYEKALALARLLVGIGNGAGKDTIAFVTGMDEPLGAAIGNWLEVVESVECLRGKNVPDLMEVTTVLGGAMVYLGGKASSIEEGMRKCRSAVWSGKAYEKMLEVVDRQGGDVGFLEKPERYPARSSPLDVGSPSAGYVLGFETTRLGMLAVRLGAGRLRMDDRIDPASGIQLLKKTGSSVEEGEPVARLWSSHTALREYASQEMKACIRIGGAPPPASPLIRTMVDRSGAVDWVTPQVA